MFTNRSVVNRIKGLRYAVRLNDFRLAQRLRMALTATLRHIDEPVRNEGCAFGGCQRLVGTQHWGPS
jgi:hypothetical protein